MVSQLEREIESLLNPERSKPAYGIVLYYKVRFIGTETLAEKTLFKICEKHETTLEVIKQAKEEFLRTHKKKLPVEAWPIYNQDTEILEAGQRYYHLIDGEFSKYVPFTRNEDVCKTKAELQILLPKLAKESQEREARLKKEQLEKLLELRALAPKLTKEAAERKAIQQKGQVEKMLNLPGLKKEDAEGLVELQTLLSQFTQEEIDELLKEQKEDAARSAREEKAKAAPNVKKDNEQSK